MKTLRKLWVLPVIAGLSILAAFLVLTAVRDSGAEAQAHDKNVRTEKAVAFRNDMRKLWEDHITWTRLFIVSAAAGAPDTAPTANRLLQNQTDIGNAIKAFYGEAAGDHLTALLRDHILIAADLIAAAKTGDSAAFNEASARWYANADDIATFLNGANPGNWPLDEMKAMMKDHLDLTLQEAAERLAGNFAADIAVYDQVHEQILGMADMLALGIINQFPRKFGG